MSRVSVPDPRDVIIKPVISEKSYGLLDDKKFTFEVDPSANKSQIKLAVAEVFDVKVTSVNTLNRQGKRRRTRQGWGKRRDVKHAIVTVDGDASRLNEIFGGAVA